MDWTDIHYRQLARLLTKHTWLWTEMVVDSTIIHTPNKDRYLWFPAEQRPIVCQLGGSNPDHLAAAAATVATYGYDEINLNCGCPSDRVAGAGCFGASLMLRPETVGEACAAIAAATPGNAITVKCRLGVDDVDKYQDVCRFVEGVLLRSPVRHFVIHSRKCHLNGLNPAQNRTIPPLKRSWVWALRRDFPEAEFSLNGGIESCHQAAAALRHEMAEQRILGVMIGRAAYNTPWHCLADADRAVFGAESNPATSRRQILQEYAAYGDAVLGRFTKDWPGTTARHPNVRTVVKPLLGLFHGSPGGKRFRNRLDAWLTKHAKREDATVSEAIAYAIEVCVLLLVWWAQVVATGGHTLAPQELSDEVLDAPPPTAKDNDRTSGFSGKTGEFDVGTEPLPAPYQRLGDEAMAPATPQNYVVEATVSA